MATSSISKNFIISSNAQAEKFLSALEESSVPFSYRGFSAVQLKSKDELKKLAELRKNAKK